MDDATFERRRLGSLDEQAGAQIVTAAAIGSNEVVALARMDRPGGNTYMVSWGGVQPMAYGFVQLVIGSNAGGHTLFQVDAEVFYDNDASDVRQSFGQGAIDAVVS